MRRRASHSLTELRAAGIRLVRAIRITRLARGTRAAIAIVRRVIGVPDYDAYVAHQARHHAGRMPLTRDAFTREMLVRRYERPGSRCC